MTPSSRTLQIGAGFGVLAASCWALQLVYARSAVTEGLAATDVVMLRFGTCGLLLLPFVLWRGIGDLAGVGWGRGLVLAICAGPPFVFLATAGFVYAPLSHGAVLLPSSAFLGSMLFATIWLGERPSKRQLAGASGVLLGLILISWTGLQGSHEGAWRGHILFVTGGVLWSTYTLLLRKWGVDGMASVAAVGLVGLGLALPLFLVFDSFDRMAQAPWQMLASQAFVHGVLVAIVALMAFGQALKYLGVTRGALFPAIVPAVSLILGIPLLGEVPAWWEALGAVFATGGLLLSLKRSA